MAKKTKEQLIQEELDAQVDILADKADKTKKSKKEDAEEAKEDKKEIGMTDKSEDEMDKQAVTTEAERIVQPYKTPTDAISEDVALLFNGQELSEDFKKRATTIFEAALAARVNSEVALIEAEAQEALAVKLAEAEEQTIAQIDEYMETVVAEWAEENKLAIETGVRQEIAESFITDLKALFEKHSIEIPEEKVNMLEAAKSEMDLLRNEVAALAAKLVEADEKTFEMEKSKVIKELSEGLAVTQAEKLNSLIKEVDAKSIESFKEKAMILRESVFTEVKKPLNEVTKETKAESDMSKLLASVKKINRKD